MVVTMCLTCFSGASMQCHGLAYAFAHYRVGRDCSAPLCCTAVSSSLHLDAGPLLLTPLVSEPLLFPALSPVPSRHLLFPYMNSLLVLTAFSNGSSSLPRLSSSLLCYEMSVEPSFSQTAADIAHLASTMCF